MLRRTATLGRVRDDCVAVIAVNQRARCKSRLANALPPDERLKLVRKMLLQVIDSARSATHIGQVIVVSPERDQLPADIPVLADSGRGLNAALVQAQQTLLGLGVRDLLVLPADLPQVAPTDIDAVVRAGRRGGFAIAPDAGGTGTNALYVGTRVAFRYQFGVNSRRRHLAEADRHGLVARVVRLPGMAFDVDMPSDLLQLDTGQWPRQLPA